MTARRGQCNPPGKGGTNRHMAGAGEGSGQPDAGYPRELWPAACSASAVLNAGNLRTIAFSSIDMWRFLAWAICMVFACPYQPIRCLYGPTGWLTCMLWPCCPLCPCRYMKDGGWVFLDNVHLMQGWIPRLERKLELAQEAAHPGFRVFFSAEPINGAPQAKIIPESILQVRTRAWQPGGGGRTSSWMHCALPRPPQHAPQVKPSCGLCDARGYGIPPRSASRPSSPSRHLIECPPHAPTSHPTQPVSQHTQTALACPV